MTVKHPAPFSDALMPVFANLLTAHALKTFPVLDPFAGIGRIHELRSEGWNTWGVEIEPEWAIQHPDTIVGDSRSLPFYDDTIGAVVTSPTFANRMADHHRATDSSYRRTYKHVLGRDLTPGNSGAMQWGGAYRLLHELVWAECHRVLRVGGPLLLDSKNHIRAGSEQFVTEWHISTLIDLGFECVTIQRVGTPGFRYGANRNARLPEKVIVMRKRA